MANHYAAPLAHISAGTLAVRGRDFVSRRPRPGRQKCHARPCPPEEFERRLARLAARAALEQDLFPSEES